MTSSSHIVGVNAGVTAAIPQAAPTSSNTNSASSITPKQISAISQASGISPRIVVDAAAGPIIQYLNSNGSVASQIPSSTVVAYLRAGLTPEGLNKQAANGGQSSTATTA